MLGKLLKYEFKSIFKFLIVFYVLALFFGALARIFLGIENSFILNIVGQVCSGASIAMIVNILINNMMRLWVRFKNNLYGDESYLTHTLPIEKKTLYLAKFITVIVSLFVSVIVIGLTLFVAYYSKDNLSALKNMLLPLANAYESTIMKIVLAFLFVFFLEIANGIQIGYTGIILGHRMNSNKVGFSVLFGFISYMAIQVISLIMIFVVALFNKDVMNLFFTNEIVNVGVVKIIIILAIVIYALALIGSYFINQKLFKKGVNVD